jgi:SAM-dependent methyltransferase
MTGDPRSEFDAHAAGYDEDLARGLRFTGDDKAFYAEGRVRQVARLLAAHGVVPRRIVDFGCGDGAATPWLLSLVGAESLLGVDVSAELLRLARERHEGPRARFHTPAEAPPDGQADLAFVNGVFHHIPPAERPSALADVHARLRPGGLFAFWENNPWNPGTRFVMSRVEFDRGAMTFGPPAARRMLRAAGFTVLGTESWFWFPRPLAFLRPLEGVLSRLPFGGQYLVLAARR